MQSFLLEIPKKPLMVDVLSVNSSTQNMPAILLIDDQSKIIPGKNILKKGEKNFHFQFCTGQQ
jgi:hypothetical protein